MKFESKAHMALALIAGNRFKAQTRDGGTLHYDERYTNPFRYGEEPAIGVWHLYGEDIWEEVATHRMPIFNGAWDLCQRIVVEEAKPRHVHQHLIDSYIPGQAWQCMPAGASTYCDRNIHGVWVEPVWNESTAYRLHPHNDLIQAHRNGAKIQAHICGDWVEEPKPDWYEDTEYRIKPATETVYEWMCKPKSGHTWALEELLMGEEEAEKYYYPDHDYRKTGRSWEVEV
jgi:hypothetical protein